jgi:protein phosphatase
VAHYFEETEDRSRVDPEYDELGLSTAARRLATGIHRANRAVVDVAKTSKLYRGMGTTIVAAFFEPDRSVVHIGHVGDSRCYRLRNGIFELLTHDHTLINDVLALRPDMPDSQLSRLPRNVITRALGMSDSVRVSIRTWELAAGDRFVLCSDGLTDRISGYQMVDALDLASSPEEQARLLLELAKEGPMDDNVAALVAACDLAPGVDEAPRPPRKHTIGYDVSHAEDDYPEIMVLGHDDEDHSSIHVVPAQDISQDLLNVIQEIVEPHRQSERPLRSSDLAQEDE